MKTPKNIIREEILKALPTPKSFLCRNFYPLSKLYNEYGIDEVFEVMGEMEKNGEIYWEVIHPSSRDDEGTTHIKRTEKSFQQV